MTWKNNETENHYIFFTYDFYSYLILFKVGLCIVDFDSLGF